MSLHPKDPKITAYALGELKGEELREVEAFLKTSSEARKEVSEIRAFSGKLKAEFATAASLSAPAAKKYLTWALTMAAALAGAVWINFPKGTDTPSGPVAAEQPHISEQTRMAKVVLDPPAPTPETRGELRQTSIDVSGHDAVIPPDLNRVQLYNVFWANMPAIRKCHGTEKDKAPTSEGEILFSFEISQEGKAVNLKTTRNSLRNDAFSDCVEEQIRSWTFPSTGKKSRTILYPIQISTE